MVYLILILYFFTILVNPNSKRKLNRCENSFVLTGSWCDFVVFFHLVESQTDPGITWGPRAGDEIMRHNTRVPFHFYFALIYIFIVKYQTGPGITL